MKLDFVKAFNSIRRDAVLEAVAQYAPNLLAYTSSSYGAASSLCFEDEVLLSEESVQQGDPLAPLLFCLALHSPISDLKTEFVSGYLDDVGAGGTVLEIIREVTQFETRAAAIGLRQMRDSGFKRYLSCCLASVRPSFCGV